MATADESHGKGKTPARSVPVLTFEQVMKVELDAVHARRKQLAAQPPRTGSLHPLKKLAPATIEADSDSDKDGIYGRALKSNLCGLAISGGGIRSATFALGILQSLAAHRMLERFDFLSTVSGGGYIGAWFSAWVKRQSMEKLDDQSGLKGWKGLEEVTKGLTPRRDSVKKIGNNADETPLDEAAPLRHLRYYSNYLAPRVGLFSINGWVLVAIYLRNLFLNQTVLLLGVLGLLCYMRGVVEIFALAHNVYLGSIIGSVAAVIAIPLILIGAFTALGHLRRLSEQKTLPDDDKRIESRAEILPKIVMPWLLAAIAVCLLVVVPKGFGWFDAMAMQVNLLLTGVLVGALHAVLGTAPIRHRIGSVLYGMLAGLIGGSVMYLALYALHSATTIVVAPIAVFGPPIVLTSFVFTNFFYVGLMGNSLKTETREWWGSINARLLLTSMIWLIAFFFVIYGPYIVVQVFVGDFSEPWRGWIRTASGFVASGWLGTVVTGLFAGNSSSTSGNDRSNRYWELFARLAPPLFVAGLLVVLATAGCWLTYEIYAGFQDNPGWGFLAQKDNLLRNLDFAKAPVPIGSREFPAWAMLFIGGLFGIGLSQLLGNRIGVNAFSLQELYTWRLIRCYLGASNSRRNPDPLTNFDVKDDLELSSLSIAIDPTAGDGVAPYPGPHLIINCALNRRIDPIKAGHEKDSLGLQFRKAESFSMTPLYCGSATTGYCPTTQFAGNVSLGTAVGISGAAVSPNMGYHSTTAITALLTAFNLRLVAWFGNPGRHTRGNANPPASWYYILRELFGDVGVKDFLYLSDGGHFENMGVYELVRRRCKYILAIDSGADANFLQENLGDLVRKVRIDFGIRIELNTELLQPDETGKIRSQFAVGVIHYEDVHTLDNAEGPEALQGVLIYIKACLTGDEPADLANYHAEHPVFPNDSTLDQFYTESQFESYRTLGVVTTDKLLESDGLDAAIGALPANEDTVFTQLRERWRIQPPHLHDGYVKDNEGYCTILEKLRTEPLLSGLAADICGYPSGSNVPTPDPQSDHRNVAVQLAIEEMMTLLENVWIDLDLQSQTLAKHPVNRGWVNVITQWAKSKSVKAVWPKIKDSYSPAFASYISKLAPET